MKKFWTILGFELKNYYKNKIFVGVTIFLVIAIAAVMFYPRISAAFDDGTPEKKQTMLVSASDTTLALVKDSLASAFGDYDVKTFSGTTEELKNKVKNGEAYCAFVLSDDLTKFTYYVNDLTMYDTNMATASALLTETYRYVALQQTGLSSETVAAIMSATSQGETQKLGVDQMQNFFYTYVMIFALYMVILLYGQMVATGVAGEKGSRSMELLVTSVKPVPMMFGKVIAACIAGFVQLACVFGSSLLFYGLNKSYWQGNVIIASIFDMPPNLVLYLLLFFVFGFFIYAFLYGAVGSTVSKTEEVGTASMPITLLFVAGFIVVIFSVSTGNVNNIAMQICSYIPFTSPMAMFTRIAMSVVPAWEIALSVGILAVSAVLTGVVAAKIYRAGVLLYGTTPKFGQILKMIFSKQ